MTPDMKARAKALLADILGSGEVGVMFVWDQNDRASYIGPNNVTEAALVKLLEMAAGQFSERHTLQ